MTAPINVLQHGMNYFSDVKTVNERELEIQVNQ